MEERGRVGSGEAWTGEEEGGWEVENPGRGRRKESGKWRSLGGGGGRRVGSEDSWMAEKVHPHERL